MIGLQYPQQQGSNLLEMMLQLEGAEAQKESLRLRKKQQELYGRQIAVTERMHSEKILEAQRLFNVATTRGLDTQANIAKQELKFLRGLKSPEDRKRYYMKDVIANELRAMFGASQEQLNLAKLQLQQESGLRAQDANIRAQKDAIRKSHQDEYDAILGPNSGLPPEDAIGFASELKQLRNVYGPVDQGAIETLYSNVRAVRGKERDRALKAEVAGETRKEDFELEKLRESWSTWPPDDKDKAKYEYGSLEELNSAHEAGVRRPEVRWLYLDPKGRGLWTVTDKTGIRIPPAYQRESRKRVTEKRALALGIHDEWLAADSPTKAIQLPGKSEVEEIPLPKSEVDALLGIRE